MTVAQGYWTQANAAHEGAIGLERWDYVSVDGLRGFVSRPDNRSMWYAWMTLEGEPPYAVGQRALLGEAQGLLALALANVSRR